MNGVAEMWQAWTHVPPSGVCQHRAIDGFVMSPAAMAVNAAASAALTPQRAGGAPRRRARDHVVSLVTPSLPKRLLGVLPRPPLSVVIAPSFGVTVSGPNCGP